VTPQTDPEMLLQDPERAFKFYEVRAQQTSGLAENLKLQAEHLYKQSEAKASGTGPGW